MDCILDRVKWKQSQAWRNQQILCNSRVFSVCSSITRGFFRICLQNCSHCMNFCRMTHHGIGLKHVPLLLSAKDALNFSGCAHTLWRNQTAQSGMWRISLWSWSGVDSCDGQRRWTPSSCCIQNAWSSGAKLFAAGERSVSNNFCSQEVSLLCVWTAVYFSDRSQTSSYYFWTKAWYPYINNATTSALGSHSSSASIWHWVPEHPWSWKRWCSLAFTITSRLKWLFAHWWTAVRRKCCQLLTN